MNTKKELDLALSRAARLKIHPPSWSFLRLAPPFPSCLPTRVGKNPGLKKNLFLGGFYWFFGVLLGFIGFLKFRVCDMPFCCILLHLNVLLNIFLSCQFSRYRKYEIPILELGRPEFKTAHLLFKRSVLICRVV
jgi:hypothetical protein